jgi:peptidoglycan/LPS O-acetylase OafA/YrhL
MRIEYLRMVYLRNYCQFIDDLDGLDAFSIIIRKNSRQMHPATPKVQAKYRPDIDGLRAIAIVSVIFYHAGFPGFSGGFVGVDVFFVISGFLITSLLFNEAVTTGRVSLSAFYARRVRRLMPAGLVVVAATLLIGGLLMPPGSDEQRALARSAKAVAYFGSNFHFFSHTGGYFDAPSFSMPLLHTWSLAIEEQYYLVWPLLMLLFFRFSKEPHAEGVMRSRVMRALGVMLILSLALCIGKTPEHQSFAFYLLPARIWEFAIGGLVGLAGTAFYSRLRRWGEGLAVVGLVLVVYSVVALNHSTVFPGWAAMLPVFGSAALIVGMTANERGVVRRLLSLKPMIFIGLLSYSWYLWHWPLLSIYRIYNLGAQDIVANAVLVMIALGLAGLTYILIERPIRVRRPWGFKSIRSTLFIGGGISLATLLMGFGLQAWNNHQRSFDAYQSIERARTDFPPYQKDCALPSDQLVGGLPREKCIHGPDRKQPKVLLWGDSHADHMMPTVMEAFSDVAVYQLTMAGCIPVIGYESRGMPGTTKSCPNFNERVLKEIIDLRKIGLKGVVISARWENYLWHQSISAADQTTGMMPIDPQKVSLERSSMQANLDAQLRTLAKIGVRVAVLAPTPSLVYSAPQCIGLGRGVRCNVPRALNEALLADTTAALEEVVSRHPNARLVRLIDFFCDSQTCYAERDGKVLYFDDDHITATAARDLGRFLKPDLAWLLGNQQALPEIKR